MKVIGIVGWKNTGKTGLTERLVTHFSGQGLRVATLKHAHKDFEVDAAGTDSHRHRMAGAGQVIVASATRIAHIQELHGAPERSLDDLLGMLGPADLVLIEGWKGAAHPKIETVLGAGSEEPLARRDPTILAVASNVAPDVPCAVLPIDDTGAIAAFIAREVGL
ncbi:MAG: molybdopterin-guanine dinucleotide biosynthesis protein B [Pseudomonadota bacterium]